MRAVLVERIADRATVRLPPSWLARLFGARETVLVLEQRPEHGDRPAYATTFRWCAAATHRELRDLPHGDLIHDALDFVPVAEPPRAIARRS